MWGTVHMAMLRVSAEGRHPSARIQWCHSRENFQILCANLCIFEHSGCMRLSRLFYLASNALLCEALKSAQLR